MVVRVSARPTARAQKIYTLTGVIATIAWTLLIIPFPAGVAAQEGGAAVQSPPPLLTQAAQAVGIRRCLPAVDATARRVSRGAMKQDLLVDWYKPAPDSGPLFSLTGFEFSGQTVVFSLTAIPTDTNQCTIMAERIATSPHPCASFAAAELAGLRATKLLPSMEVYTNPNRPSETITLVNTAPGCLVIRRQATFEWGK